MAILLFDIHATAASTLIAQALGFVLAQHVTLLRPQRRILVRLEAARGAERSGAAFARSREGQNLVRQGCGALGRRLALLWLRAGH